MEEHDRDLEWIAIFGGVRSLFLEDIEDKNISTAKAEKFEKYFEKGLLSESSKDKKECLIEIRKLFSNKDELNHFLYISGVINEPPKKPSQRIRAQFYT